MTILFAQQAFLSPGGGELIMIMLVLIMLFGAKDAPRILRKIQNFMDEIRSIAANFRYEMMYSDLHDDQAEENTVEADYTEYGDPDEYDAYAEVEAEEETTRLLNDAQEPESGAEAAASEAAAQPEPETGEESKNA